MNYFGIFYTITSYQHFNIILLTQSFWFRAVKWIVQLLINRLIAYFWNKIWITSNYWVFFLITECFAVYQCQQYKHIVTQMCVFYRYVRKQCGNALWKRLRTLINFISANSLWKTKIENFPEKWNTLNHKYKGEQNYFTSIQETNFWNIFTCIMLWRKIQEILKRGRKK